MSWETNKPGKIPMEVFLFFSTLSMWLDLEEEFRGSPPERSQLL